ncbi:MAG: filamentous hemagglutinin N-terminal domain-containing protein [Leptolyngbya sp. SIO1E4]|nr:filamentous hemagglutinin N-terminal domain-containing protein [Leptolyngbya sp. SIO1E4]
MKEWDSRRTASVLTGVVGGSITLLGYSALFPVPGVAQLIPDNSLGAESSIVTPEATVQGLPADLIEGGATRGANLFHSFADFNVNTGQSVYFANPIGIENILSRVTGSNVSNIDGLLGVDGAANLFLLNPNGVIFGPNARLDVSGSFITSTANSFTFADGSEFSAMPTGNELLSVSVPLGVQFNDPPQGDITSTGILEAGQDLTLLGNDLYLEGQVLAGQDLMLQAQDTVTIRDTATDAFVARTGGDLTIQGNQGVDIWTLQHLEQTPFVSGGDLTLISDGVISGDAHFDSGGSLQFLNLAGGPGNIVSFYDPIIFADGDVVFGDYTGVALKVEATGSIQAGNIRITGPDIGVPATDPDAALLNSSSAVILRAGVDSVGAANVPQTNVGDLNTSFTAGTVAGQPPGSIVVGGIDTSDSSGGDGGPIILVADSNISIAGDILAFATSPAGDAGNGGDISISSISGDITTNGRLNSRSQSEANSGDAGNGGNISITSTSGNITLNNYLSAVSFSTPDPLADSGDAGNGGNVSIASTSGNITLKDFLDTRSLSNGSIQSSSGDAGDGGDISISSTSGSITIDNRLASSSTSNSRETTVTGDAGNGGDIAIASTSGDITLNGQVLSNSASRARSSLVQNASSVSGNAGNGGNISISSISGDITANNTLDSFSGSFSIESYSNAPPNSGYMSSSVSGDAGNGGNISLTSISGDVAIRSSLFSGSFADSIVNSPPGTSFIPVSGNAGDGGNIEIASASGNITVDQDLASSSFSSDGNAGDGGAIVLSAPNGNIQGSAGAVVVVNPDGSIQTNANVFAFAVAETDGKISGNGGQVTLVAREVISGLDVQTLSSDGISGDVQIQGTGDLTARNVDLTTSGTISIRNPISPTEFITLSTDGFGPSGNTNITSLGNLTFDTVQILGNANGPGAAGNITTASPGNITLINSAINSNTTSTGAAGNIEVEAGRGLTIQGAGSGIFASTNAEGAGGSITVNTPRINLEAGTAIAATTSSEARGGNLAFNAPNALTIEGTGTITADTESGGRAGDLDVNATQIVIDGTRLSASTSGTGSGGDIRVNADRSLTIQGAGSGIFASTNAEGEGGSIAVNTPRINLGAGTEISATTSSEARGGNLTFNAPNALAIEGTGTITADTEGNGRAGDLDINAAQVAIDGTQLSASTRGAGAGGDIRINTAQLSFANGGRVAAATTGSGRGGSFTVQNDGPLTIQGQGELTVGAIGANSGLAGDLNILGTDLLFDDGVVLSATSESLPGGGNVNLRSRDAIILREGSFINAESTNPNGGDGGNVTISTDFLIAGPNENNDIIANAVGGNGGRIEVEAINIFGFTEPNGFTTAQLRANQSNDLSASSAFGLQGEIVLNTLDVDPARGLTELPVDLADRTNQIVAGCGLGNTDNPSEFVITGRGGLPPSPSDLGTAAGIDIPWVTYDGDTSTAAVSPPPVPETEGTLVEAQDMVVDAEGNVYFVAIVESTSPQHSGLPPAGLCAATVQPESL